MSSDAIDPCIRTGQEDTGLWCGRCRHRSSAEQLQRPLAEAGHVVPHCGWHVAGALVIEHLGFASENLVQTPL